MSLPVFVTSIDGSEKAIVRLARSALDAVAGLSSSCEREAKAVLVADDAYLSLAAALRLQRRFHGKAVVAYLETDWPLVVFPGLYPSIHRIGFASETVARPWAYLRACQAEQWSISGVPPPDFLFSFLGRTATHPVRRSVAALHTASSPCLDISDAPQFFPGFDPAETYRDVLRRSAFVVCPRGFGSSSIRIFEAMAVGRVPVIIGDHWVPPPVGNWDNFSIRVPEASVARIPAILADRAGDAEAMGARAKDVFLENFSSRRFFSGFMQMAVSALVPNLGRTLCLLPCNDWKRHARSFARDIISLARSSRELAQ